MVTQPHEFLTSVDTGKEFVVTEPASSRDATEYKQYAASREYHTIELKINAGAFSSVIWQKRCLLAAIPTCFNICGIDAKRNYKLTLFDVIKHLENDTYDWSVYDAVDAANLLTCITDLPQGWRLSALRQYWPVALPDLPSDWPDLQRPAYYTGLFQWPIAHALIHPYQHRPMSDSELAAIEASNGERGLIAWLGELEASMTRCERRKPGCASWYAAAPSEQIPRKERPPRLFNWDADKLIFAWEEIKRHHARWRQANNVHGPFFTDSYSFKHQLHPNGTPDA